AGRVARCLDGADHAERRARDAKAAAGHGRGAGAEGAGEDALPAHLPDLPGDVHRAAPAGHDRLLPRPQLGALTGAAQFVGYRCEDRTVTRTAAAAASLPRSTAKGGVVLVWLTMFVLVGAVWATAIH